MPFYLWTEQTKIRQFWENLKNQKLTTTYCSECNERHWPPRHMCPKCYGIELDWTELKQEGVLETFTEIGVALPTPGSLSKKYSAVVNCCAE